MFQRLGYFPTRDDIPPLITKHIIGALQLPADFYTSLDQMPSSSQRLQKTLIRQYCRVDKFVLKEQGVWLKSAAQSYARTKETIVDIINAMLELLIKERTELPALSTQERIATAARSRANDGYFNAIVECLPYTAIQVLLSLLNEKSSSGETLWNQKNQASGNPSILPSTQGGWEHFSLTLAISRSYPNSSDCYLSMKRSPTLPIK